MVWDSALPAADLLDIEVLQSLKTAEALVATFLDVVLLVQVWAKVLALTDLLFDDIVSFFKFQDAFVASFLDVCLLTMYIIDK